MSDYSADMRVFDVENGIVKINENCLLIPFLRDVIEFYEDPIPALCFLYFKYDPSSPYANYDNNDKDEVLLRNFPGDYTTEDDVLIEAAKHLENFYKTPLQLFLEECKAELFRMIDYLKTNPISGGRDGDINERFRILKEAGKLAESYNSLEKQAKEQLKQRLRGNTEMGEY